MCLISLFIQEIPTPYFKRFKKVLPPYVVYALPDGKLFKGRYSIGDRKLYDLLEMVIYSKLEVDDVLMFTNWGYGQFDVVVFNKSGVEKAVEEVGVKTGNKFKICIIGYYCSSHYVDQSYWHTFFSIVFEGSLENKIKCNDNV